ncbi:hypothetical protein XH93_33725 [Bradyrhizobium sp. CCBAU 51753]|nr:hypothetical protein XH93_33725 [Bradyrhizobium sp. CCBAU 51753]
MPHKQGRAAYAVSSPGLTGGPSTPRPIGRSLPPLEYWIARSSRAMTADLPHEQGRAAYAVSSPGLTGGPSTPRPIGRSLPPLECWIARSSRAMTAGFWIG